MNLERLAELINARWPETAEFIGDRRVIPNVIRINITENVAGRRRFCFCPKWDDLSMNAYWIIWCLDRLEELWRNHWAEQVSNLRHGIDLIGAVAGDEEYCVHVVVYPESDNWTPTAMYPPGKTRAEACALALMQALEGE